MKLRFVEALQVGAGLTCGLVLAGCAKHADFLEIRDQVSIIARTQDQEQKRFVTVAQQLDPSADTGIRPVHVHCFTDGMV